VESQAGAARRSCERIEAALAAAGAAPAAGGAR
jgi:hypothetical protein